MGRQTPVPYLRDDATPSGLSSEDHPRIRLSQMYGGPSEEWAGSRVVTKESCLQSIEDLFHRKWRTQRRLNTLRNFPDSCPPWSLTDRASHVDRVGQPTDAYRRSCGSNSPGTCSSARSRRPFAQPKPALRQNLRRNLSDCSTITFLELKTTKAYV